MTRRPGIERGVDDIAIDDRRRRWLDRFDTRRLDLADTASGSSGVAVLTPVGLSQCLGPQAVANRIALKHAGGGWRWSLFGGGQQIGSER